MYFPFSQDLQRQLNKGTRSLLNDVLSKFRRQAVCFVCWYTALSLVNITWRRWQLNEYVCSIGGMMLTGENRSSQKETCHSDTLSPTVGYSNVYRYQCFRSNILNMTSLTMRAVFTSETTVTTYQPTWCQNRENHNLKPDLPDRFEYNLRYLLLR